MRTRIALDAQILAFVEPVFVFGMEGGAAADHLKDPAQALVVFDQQGPGGGADENLHPRAARRALQVRQIRDVLAGAADEEREIAMHAVATASDLLGEG